MDEVPAANVESPLEPVRLDVPLSPEYGLHGLDVDGVVAESASLSGLPNLRSSRFFLLSLAIAHAPPFPSPKNSSMPSRGPPGLPASIQRSCASCPNVSPRSYSRQKASRYR